MESTHKARRFSNLSDTVHADQATGETGDPKPKAGGGVGSLAGGVSDSEAVLCANPNCGVSFWNPEGVCLCPRIPLEIAPVERFYAETEVPVCRPMVYQKPTGVGSSSVLVLEAPEGGNEAPKCQWWCCGLDESTARKYIKSPRLVDGETKSSETWMCDRCKRQFDSGSRGDSLTLADSSCLMAVYGRLAERWQG